MDIDNRFAWTLDNYILYIIVTTNHTMCIMDRIPFFVSLPRTRSSVLFEMMRPFVDSCLNTTLSNHSELFLHWGRSHQCVNAGSGETQDTELLPFVTKGGMSMHYVWPHVFDNPYDRNMHKLDLLQKERDCGREYFIKGTMTIYHGYKDIIDFYADRQFVITSRKNTWDMILSLLVAWETKVFLVRTNTVDNYMNKIASVTISEETFLLGDKYIRGLQQFEDVTQYIRNNYDYYETEYDGLSTQKQRTDTVTRILGSNDWNSINYTGSNIPIEVTKNYRALITNMDQVETRYARYR